MSTAAPPTQLQEAVRALARASRVLERASGELSLAHYRVLSAIAAGDERASRIAARLALGKPTVSAAVDALCQRGLLTRLDVAGDRRATALALTAAGAALLVDTETQMALRLETLCARTASPAGVIDALAALGQAIEQVAHERDTRA